MARKNLVAPTSPLDRRRRCHLTTLTDPNSDVCLASPFSPCKPSHPRRILEKSAAETRSQETSNLRTELISPRIHQRTRSLHVDGPCVTRWAASSSHDGRVPPHSSAGWATSDSHDRVARPLNNATRGNHHHLTLPCLAHGPQGSQSSRSTTASGSRSSSQETPWFSSQETQLSDLSCTSLPVIKDSDPPIKAGATANHLANTPHRHCSSLDTTGCESFTLEVVHASAPVASGPAPEVKLTGPRRDGVITTESSIQALKSATDLDNEFQAIFSSAETSHDELAELFEVLTHEHVCIGHSQRTKPVNPTVARSHTEMEQEAEEEMRGILEEGRVARQFIWESRKAVAQPRDLNTTMERVRSKLTAVRASMADI